MDGTKGTPRSGGVVQSLVCLPSGKESLEY